MTAQLPSHTHSWLHFSACWKGQRLRYGAPRCSHHVAHAGKDSHHGVENRAARASRVRTSHSVATAAAATTGLDDFAAPSASARHRCRARRAVGFAAPSTSPRRRPRRAADIAAPTAPRPRPRRAANTARRRQSARGGREEGPLTQRTEDHLGIAHLQYGFNILYTKQGRATKENNRASTRAKSNGPKSRRATKPTKA